MDQIEDLPSYGRPLKGSQQATGQTNPLGVSETNHRL